MPAPSAPQPPAFTLGRDPRPEGGLRFRLQGHLTLAEGAALWQQLQAAFLAPSPGHPEIEFDVTEVDHLDGGAAALLSAAFANQASQGRSVQVQGARREVARILELYDCRLGDRCERESPRGPGLLSEIGAFAEAVRDNTRNILAFLGDLIVGILQALRRPRTVHFGELGSLIERAGADGIAIVVLINFLIGAILGLQGARQLHRFGGDNFLANLVGLSVVRELGPLMTAILVTGRSGAAYAAELGTMTVNEEIDALRTLGQDPQRFLVFPRVLALVCVLPILTVLGDLVGTLGGLAIAVGYLDQPSVVYLQALQRAVTTGDVGTGLLKSLAFAVAIALIACQRGLATRSGAAGVGRSTTSAVVVVLFMLVALDAVFTWVFSLLGW